MFFSGAEVPATELVTFAFFLNNYLYPSLITRLFEICSTSLVLIRNFPLRFCNFPMSMSTNDVEQISNNRVIN